MRILLVDPPYANSEIGGERQNFKGVLNKIPSLGLAYLAAVAEREGHAVRVIDCTLDGGHAALEKTAGEFAPDVVGITATTPTFRSAVSAAVQLRSRLKGARFVCGGPHATASVRDIFAAGAFDFAVIGEGEATFLELTSFLQQSPAGTPENIRGIAFKKGAEVVITVPRPRLEDLDALPFPARHLFPPPGAYRPTPASYRRLPLAVIMTSRGCPSACTFCDRAVFGERFRQRTVSNVMAEIEEVISRFGCREIRFFDDTFTLDPVFVDGLCHGLERLRPRIPWTCLTKVTAVNPQMLTMMRQAGCWQVLFGLESGDDYVLERLAKHTTVRKNREAVSMAHKAGLSIRADFVVGTPWETEESLRRTIDFAKSLPLDFAHFNKFVPYPGTAIYRELIAAGSSLVFDDSSYINNQADFPYVPPGISALRYRSMLNGAYKEFYLRPGYILRRLLAIRTLDELAGQLRGACSVLSL